jgi:hypothetical protein
LELYGLQPHQIADAVTKTLGQNAA